MANILILTLVFPPDGVSTAQIMGDLAYDLKSKGHSVIVLTTSPHYNRDPEAESQQPLRRYWGRFLQKSYYRQIPVFHSIMPRKGNNILLRLLAWIGFHILGTFVGMTVIPKTDIIITPSPPLTIGISAWIIGRFRRAPYIYNVQEIYPDIAIRLGSIRNPKVIRFFYGLERFVYQKAVKITVIAPRMREKLYEKGVCPGKIEVIPNFVDIKDFSPLPKDNYFSRRHSVVDIFTVSYAGNMGVPQGLTSFIDAAIILQKESQIRFLMMGDGMQKGALLRRVQASGLNNFVFLPYQPYSLVPQIYASSNVNLVPQAAETGYEAVPSKIYRIMACARPIIAVTDRNSDLAHLVQEAGCGVVVSPGSGEKLAEAILSAHKNQAEWLKMGESGRSYVVQHYARDVVTNRYHELIKEMISI